MTQNQTRTIKPTVQHTLNDSITFEGNGVHSNAPVLMVLNPAPANTGIIFVRTDDDGYEVEIPAHYNSVAGTELCTIVGDPKGYFVATIEHLMAALRALCVDNVRIDISGAEVPVMDGSSSAFVNAIQEVGLMTQAARRRYIRIEKPVRVEMGEAFGELLPYDGCEFDVEIQFDDPTIGRQRYVVELGAETFAKDIARARTFGFMKDVENLWNAGYALGSSLENSVVIGDDGVVNQEGLRFEDEFVRHKLLDAVGDLSLSGVPIMGRYRSFRGGHKLNFMVLKALFENKDCWSFYEPENVGSVTPKPVEMPNQPAAALAPNKD